MVTCRDGCGREVTQAEATRSAWFYLPIQNRWRCPTCWRLLDQLNRQSTAAELDLGAGGPVVDNRLL